MEEANGMQEANGESLEKFSCLTHTGCFCLLFVACWFGTRRLEVDGSEAFDPEEARLLLRGELSVLRNFFMRKVRQHREQPTDHPGNDGEQPPPEAQQAPVRGRLDGGEDGGQISPDDLPESWEMQRWPVFIVVQSTFALLLWIVGSAVRASKSGGSFLTMTAGLDSFSDGWSRLRLSGEECQDQRWQLWRIFTYQWTHCGLFHVLSNFAFNLFLGIPLEGLHGSMKMLVIYNAGILGGACCFWVAEAHVNVVGMSSGSAALLGMHLADLVMRWPRAKLRKYTLIVVTSPALAVILELILRLYGVLAPAVNDVSHAAHVGGCIAGLLLGIATANNGVVGQRKRVVWWGAAFVGSVLLLFSLWWMGAHFPPQNFMDPYGYCWTRQVYSSALDSGKWVCVRCGTRECIDRFTSEMQSLSVQTSACTDIRNGDHLPL